MMRTVELPKTAAPPAAVRYNDWRRIEVETLESFRPDRPATVVVPYYQAPRELAPDPGGWRRWRSA